MPEAFSLPCWYSLRGYRDAKSLPGLKAGPLQMVCNIQHFWFAGACFLDELTQRSCLSHYWRKNRGLTQAQGSTPSFSVWIFVGWTAQVFFEKQTSPRVARIVPLNRNMWRASKRDHARSFRKNIQPCVPEKIQNEYIWKHTQSKQSCIPSYSLKQHYFGIERHLQCAYSLCLRASSFVV